MAPSNLQHRRTHNLLLITKLLTLRDTISPFTLIFDSLEQSARPLLVEYLCRASESGLHVIFISFESIRGPPSAETQIDAIDNPDGWHKATLRVLAEKPTQRKLLIIDSLNTVAATHHAEISSLLASLMNPTTSILAIYHSDVPYIVPRADDYSPPMTNLLRYLATTIFTTHAIHHVLARKQARDRSQAEPEFGLNLGLQGVLQSLGANGSEGVVLEMEHRRRSGRNVNEWYFLPARSRQTDQKTNVPAMRLRENTILLEDHPKYKTVEPQHLAAGDGEDQPKSTFELGLTEKQRQDREGVVLPYFDAQTGGGEGGRIIYDIGSEDDFDEDEDEI